jgi:hypothetical protein
MATWFIDEPIEAGEVIPDSIRVKASMENAVASCAHPASGSSRRWAVYDSGDHRITRADGAFDLDVGRAMKLWHSRLAGGWT